MSHPPRTVASVADPDRLKLYRYLAAQEADDYVAIMGHFKDALLAEWSPRDLPDHIDLPVDLIAARCKYLADNGNLLLSPAKSGSRRSPNTRASPSATPCPPSAPVSTGRSKRSSPSPAVPARCPGNYWRQWRRG